MSIAEAICLSIASAGISIPIRTIVLNLVSISLELLLCPVDRLPSCPVPIACNISRASSPLVSPTIILSGLILRLDLIRSLIETSLSHSILDFLTSSLTRLLTPWICNSAESSIVITRSSLGIKLDSALRNVVLPCPH